MFARPGPVCGTRNRCWPPNEKTSRCRASVTPRSPPTLYLQTRPQTASQGEFQHMSETFVRTADGVFGKHSEAKLDVHATPAYQAYQVLHAGFIAAPLLAGLD